MTDLSSEPADKLRACLSHGWPESEEDLPPSYISACARWFAELSVSNRIIAQAAIGKHARGDSAGAERLAADLPPAPRLRS